MKYLAVKFTTVVGLIFLLGACSSDSADQSNKSVFENYTWMVGTWNLTDDPGIYEEWKMDSTMMSGISFKVWEGDTNILERLEVTKSDGVFRLEVFLSDTTDPVVFTMEVEEAKRMRFSNPQHDFPKEILYSKIGLNSLRAEISGNDRRERFLYVRR